MPFSNPRPPIIRPTPEQDVDGDAAITLRALGWTLGDDDRARRLLAVTGLTPEMLRARIGEPAVLAAVIAFLEAHEADLIACADAIGVKPADLVRAREALER